MKTYPYSFALLLLTAVIYFQCTSSQRAASTNSGAASARLGAEETATTWTLQRGCPLDKVNWISGSKEFDTTAQAALSNVLRAAALHDAQTLEKMAQQGVANPLLLESRLRVVVDSIAQHRIQVSEAFYKDYAASRLTFCSYIEALRNGSVRKEESMKATETAFRRVSSTFENAQPKE